MKPYKTIEEWRRDMDIYKNNPNDTRFLVSVADRVTQSSMAVQEGIKEIVETDMFVNDTLQYLDLISRRQPGVGIIIKSISDPWFEA